MKTDATAKALPFQLLPVALRGASNRMTATPVSATAPAMTTLRRTRSWSITAPNGTRRTGVRVPMNSALATRVRLTAVKKVTMLTPNIAPAGAVARTAFHGSGERRTMQTTCHTAALHHRRQKATTVPEVCENLTMLLPVLSTTTATATAMRPAV